MTCNNVILAQPQADSTVNYTIPAGDSARLNFGPEEISGIRLDGDGGLIISFEDGGQLIITNFEELANSDSLMYLADGTLIDPSVLTTSLQSPEVFNAVETAAIESDINTVMAPGENTTQEINMTEGQKYICNFDPKSAATVEIVDGKMVLTFADGSQVVFNNYSEMMAGELPPELTLADGSVVDGDELLTEVLTIEDITELAEATEETSEDVANIEPAAGEEPAEDMSDEELAAIAQELAGVTPAAGDTGGSSNSGYGFNSKPVEVLLDSPDALGPLDPTRLQYNAPAAQGDNPLTRDYTPIVKDPIEVLDETSLSTGELVATGTLEVDYGHDFPGTITPNGSFSVTGSVDTGDLRSGGELVVITQTENGYEGVANGVTVFTFEMNPNSGSYTYTQFETLDHADADDHNDRIQFNLGFNATDKDGDVSDAVIRISVADDAPVVTSQIASAVDETDAVDGKLITTGQFHADLGQDVVANEYSANNTFIASGSVANGTLSSNGEEVTVSNNGDNVYTGVTSSGDTVFTLTFDTDTGEYTYEQFAPLDHADVNDANDMLTLQFGITITDFDGDTDSGFITVNVFDDAPKIDDMAHSIDEDNLDAGPIVIKDDLGADFHADGAGSVETTGDFAATGSIDNGTLSHNGVAITVTSTPNGYVGAAGALTVFTLDIDPTTGEYTFTQFEALDHADNNDANDVITLTFGAEITDYDGDTDTANIVIDIADSAVIFQDGGPQSDNGLETVDETNLDQPLVETGTLDADFGEDGPGTYEGIPSQIPTGLTHCGEDVTVTFDADTNTFTGATAAGTAVLTLVIDPTTGDYTYTQNLPLDHPDTSDANDVITLEFGVNALDGEGEAAEGSIVINVRDDGPEAVDDTNSIGRKEQTATGNVLDNDDFGADGGSNSIQQPGTYTGNFGTLVIAADGSYTYTRSGNVDGVDSFTYSIIDCDGDVSSANLDITLHKDHSPIGISGSGTTDDTNVDGSRSEVETGVIAVNHQGDGFGSTTANGTFSSNGSQLGALSSNGSNVRVTLSGNTYTGRSDAGETVFTMTINANGTYRFVQHENLDHSATNSHNEALYLNFGVRATDSDGDAGNGTVRITVRDDGPDARNDSTSVTGTANRTGNVLSNDDGGADDGSIAVLRFNVNGSWYNAGQTANTSLGTIKVNTDGTYTFDVNRTQTSTSTTTSTTGTWIRDSLNGPRTMTNWAKYRTTTKQGGNLKITYEMRDSDGDKDTANLNISVAPIITSRTVIDTGTSGDWSSPLVLDLDDDGIELTNVDGGVLFDFDNDGELEQTAWVKSDDGLLAMDRDGDGLITDRTELFGDTNGATDGFDRLDDLDTNQDGVITTEDENFEDLVVWRDLNQDGISDAEELFSLEQLEIVSLFLNAELPEGVYIEGSWISHVSSYLTEDGETHEIVDAWFRYDNGSFSQSGALETSNNEDVSGTGAFAVTGAEASSLTSHSNEITVTYNEGTNIYFGMTEDGIVFNLKVENDGTYNFNLFDTIDQTSDSENLTLQFGVNISDASGDNVDGNIDIHIIDTESLFANDAVSGDDAGFTTEDAAFFQAINEASDTMMTFGEEGSDIDITGMLETADDVTASIQDFVHQEAVDNSIAEAEDVPAAVELGAQLLPDLANDIGSII